MPELWKKSQGRAAETLAVWRQFRPLMTMGGRLPDAFAADAARLEPLGTVLAEARTAVRVAKQAELAAFHRLRSLNLSIPLLIAGRFDRGHRVRLALEAVFELVPRSDALNLQRARRLIAVWRMADAVLAAGVPAEAIVREGVGLPEFTRLVADYPQAGLALAETEAEFRLARSALRQQHRLVDRLNKRVYQKLKAEGRFDAVLAEVLAKSITREPASGSRTRRTATGMTKVTGRN